MVRQIYICFALLLVTASVSLSSGAKLSLLDDPDARCLDGTAGGYYYEAATKTKENNSWVIHLQGGGECVNKDSCEAKIGTSIGSSKYWPASVNFTDKVTSSFRGNGGGDEATKSWGEFGWWVLGDNKETNPDLHGYNHVFIPYCSQDLWSGQQTSPKHLSSDGKTKDEGWYFAGHLIFSAVLADLESVGLKDASLIILSGNSAGGMGTWLHVDWVAERFPKAEVVSISIAGFYAYSYPYTGPHATDPAHEMPSFTEAAFSLYVTLWDAFMDADCILDNKDAPHHCMVASRSAPYIKSRSYVVQSQTDRLVLEMHDQLPPDPYYWGPAARTYIRSHHHNMSTHLLDFMRNPVHHGVFSAACWKHDSFTVTSPTINGVNYKQAFGNWLLRSDHDDFIFFDDCGEFCNPTCEVPSRATPPPPSRLAEVTTSLHWSFEEEVFVV